MKEYIEREALYEKAYWHGEYPDVDNPYADGVEAVDVKDIDAIPAADVVEVFRGEDSALSEFETHYKDFEKIKTHLAQIIVEGKAEKPYYSILWFDEESKEYNVGYSSYCLDYVRKWLELVFEVVDATPDVVERKRGEWVDISCVVHDYDDDWIATQYQCSLCGRKEYKKEPFCNFGTVEIDMDAYKNLKEVHDAET